MIDLQDSGWWIFISGLLAGIGVWARGVFLGRDEFSDSSKSIDSRFDTVETRVSKLEVEISHLPSASFISDVRVDLAALKSENAIILKAFNSMDHKISTVLKYQMRDAARDKKCVDPTSRAGLCHDDDDEAERAV